WAGPPQPITLPELLRLAVQQAPSLQTAKLDIAVAEAQIAQTWVRNDWALKAQVAGTFQHGGSIQGIPLDSSGLITSGVDITHLLPTGGTIDLHGGVQYTKGTSSGVAKSL